MDIRTLHLLFILLLAENSLQAQTNSTQCTIEDLATALVAESTKEQLNTLQHADVWEFDPLASQPALTERAAVLVEPCRNALLKDSDSHVRAMLTSEPSWLVRSVVLAANRKASGTHGDWNEAKIGYAIDYLNTLPWPQAPKLNCTKKNPMKTIDVSFHESQAWYTFRTVPYFDCGPGHYLAYLPEQGWQELEPTKRNFMQRAITRVRRIPG
jgi:hypothetical protein